jgi:tetraacyldisaccharide 4'-kinase
MKGIMPEMNNWQRIWNDDGNIRRYTIIKIIASAISLPYRLIITFRNRLYDKKIFTVVKLPCPVISVGNIAVGGTGKTPCVIMLARMLQSHGFKPAILSRGYGGSSTKSVNIVADGKNILLDSKTAGDEPFLMAQSLRSIPIIVGPQRIKTGKTAINRFGANVLICDDAMQHRQIFRDINLVLLDGQDPLGNGHVLPRGKLREPIAGLKRASAFLLTRTNETPKTDNINKKLSQTGNIPIFTSIHKLKDVIKGDYSDKWPIAGLKGKKVCAFCGIAKPDSFKKSLLAAECHILSLDTFPDHHNYSRAELEIIKSKFYNNKADLIITTQKDGMRLQNFAEFLSIIYMMRIEMKITPSQESFDNFILDRLAAARINPAAAQSK